ncbi:MAG: M48 family metalloprotease [Planctomycetes bacterium]|nr:M48 family metalloprotease [Planctomycetota bacterium]
MAGFFYNLGKAAGPGVRKGKWLWQSFTGDENDIREAERGVGRDLAAVMKREMGVEDDPDRRAMISAIGDALAAVVKNRKIQFDLTIAARGQPNAFALPGGFIFITRALIDGLNRDRDQLAFVIGHEMGHVIKQHPSERATTDAAIRAAIRAVPAAGAAGQWFKSTGAQLMQSAYSQDREFVADQFGARLAQAAGFDPRAAMTMLAALAKWSDAPEAPPLWEYFATHPPLKKRIAALEHYLAKKADDDGD